MFHNFKWHYWEQICEYELKTTPYSFEFFSFVEQLAWVIEEHLDVIHCYKNDSITWHHLLITLGCNILPSLCHI